MLFRGKKREGVQKPENTAAVDVMEAVCAEGVYGGLGWYRRKYAQSVKCLFLVGLGLILSLGLNLLQLLNSPSPRYFASSPDGKVIELVPLDRPIMTQAGLLGWASEAVAGALALNFLQWRTQLTAARENFTQDAFQSFVKSMQDAGIISMIEEKRLSVSAVVSRAPVIVASGVQNGRMTWRIECPLVVSYESSQGIESTQRLLAAVLVQRVNTATSPKGFAITQVVFNREVQ